MKDRPELQKLIALVEAALIRAGQEARKRAEQTGTPLVVRNNAISEQSWFQFAKR